MAWACGAAVDGGRPRQLFQQADRALYVAKAAGRNRVITAPVSEEPAILVDVTDDHAPILRERATEIA